MSHTLNLSKLRNLLNINPKYVFPLFSIQWGWDRNPLNIRISFGRQQTQSLYYNGMVFVRVMLPFYVGFMFRWSGSYVDNAYLQTHVGWKLNGNFAVTLRIQSDLTAATGHQFPNAGQAISWDDGPK